jgi:hypothetical protein
MKNRGLSVSGQQDTQRNWRQERRDLTHASLQRTALPSLRIPARAREMPLFAELPLPPIRRDALSHYFAPAIGSLAPPPSSTSTNPATSKMRTNGNEEERRGRPTLETVAKPTETEAHERNPSNAEGTAATRKRFRTVKQWKNRRQPCQRWNRRNPEEQPKRGNVSRATGGTVTTAEPDETRELSNGQTVGNPGNSRTAKK